MGDRRLRHDAVAEVEDERPARKGFQHLIDRTIKCLTAGDQHKRIEIALHRHAALDLLTREGPIDHPVEADGIDWHLLGITLERRASTTRKADDLRARDDSPDLFHDSPGRLDAPTRE